MLDRAHRVEREAGGGDNGTAGLGADPHSRGNARLGAGAPGGLGPFLLAGGRLAVDVRHAEPAADHELGQAERGEESAQDFRGLFEGRGVEHLAADVGVHADQLDARHELERGHGLSGRPRGH